MAIETRLRPSSRQDDAHPTAPSLGPAAPASHTAWDRPIRILAQPDLAPVGGHVGYEPLKRMVDIVGAVLALVLGAPVIGILALAVLIGSGRPILYRANRVGRDGQQITVLKFRTMRRDSEELLQRLLAEDQELASEFRSTFKLRNDPRLTAVGRFLRKTSLDEVPQFWNVLRGSMSLVGPRPIVAEELPLYAQVPGGAEAYLAVKPGLTGSWQVSGRSDVTYEERVLLDLEYVAGRNLVRDLEIIIRTPAAAIHGHGAY